MIDRFIELFKENLELENTEVKPGDAFREYERWDSLRHLLLIAMIDEEYNVVIETDEFEKIVTVEELFAAINNKLKAEAK
jgi:acyl carrier protein